MKPVIQQERTGCGIAAAAAIAGVPYRRVKAAAKSMGISADDERLWSDTAYVRRILARFGIRVRRAAPPFRSWGRLPTCALLAIKWRRKHGRPYWHWVVFVREPGGSYVLDSNRALRRHVRTDFGRIKPKWSLAVSMERSPAERDGRSS